MQILECGTLVTTKLNKIEGMITAVTIRFTAIIYEITYGDEFRTVYMRQDEFEVTSETKSTTIGFKNGKNTINE